MSYYNTVQTKGDHQRMSMGRPGADRDFGTLLEREGPWTIDHLYALRIYCEKPTDFLGVLKDHEKFAESTVRGSPEVMSLVHGPKHSITQDLPNMSETHIVRQYDPDSLGSGWAAFGSLLRTQAREQHKRAAEAQQEESTAATTTPVKSQRARKQTQQPDGYVNSETMQVGSSPPGGQIPKSKSDANIIGYTDNAAGDAVEDATVRLASCFVRYVLMYGQEVEGPVLEFRDEKTSVKFKFPAPGPNVTLRAIDDGGIRFSGQGAQSRGLRPPQTWL